MNQHRYILQKGSKKHLCPSCGKKRFVPYEDSTTGQQLPKQYGRCDRAINCTYHLNPYSDGYAKLISDQENGQDTSNNKPRQPKFNKKPASPAPPPAPSLIPLEILKQSRAGYKNNNFILWLNTMFDIDTVNQLISRYHLGTSKHWNGATVFWQIDQAGQIRSGKIMHYSPTTGKRTKEPFNHITWAHKALKLPDFNLQQCYFGSHLLNDTQRPAALVESEKTALIASVYLPEFIWLAVGSLTNINYEKCQVLTSRKVYLFPDLNGFELWSRKAKELNQQMPGTSFEVSKLLEQIATEAERTSGLDLSDYLIRFDHRNFKQPHPASLTNPVLPPLAESEKGEKREAPETNFINQPEPLPTGKNLTKPYIQKHNSPTEKEYYRYSYSELCQAKGTELANTKVKQYQELSEKYKACKSWFLHKCELLTSFEVFNQSTGGVGKSLGGFQQLTAA